MNNRRQGNDFETLAADFLRRQGYSILQQNFYCKMGEIDIVAKDNEFLVFVEVKYRKTKAKGTAAEAVNFNKKRKICRCADVWLMMHESQGDISVRFDVIAIEEGHLKHFKNAFEYIPVC